MKNSNSGFTLVELMIVVIIVAILTSIAVPSYFEQIKKSRRTDAMNLLTDCAAAQARNYSTASPPTYLTLDELTAANLCNNGVSPKGHYQITNVANPGCTVNGVEWCFVITAQAVADSSSQAIDTLCTTWTIDHRNVTTATNDTGDDTTAECWRT